MTGMHGNPSWKRLVRNQPGGVKVADELATQRDRQRLKTNTEEAVTAH